MEALLSLITVPLLKGLGLGLTALVLFLTGKSKGKDQLTIKLQDKEIKDAKGSQTLKSSIDAKSDDDLRNSL